LLARGFICSIHISVPEAAGQKRKVRVPLALNPGRHNASSSAYFLRSHSVGDVFQSEYILADPLFHTSPLSSLLYARESVLSQSLPFPHCS